MKYIDMWFYYFLGVPACCAAQSACCGLRYRFGADRTMRASTHALRMPNAIVYACFYEGGGFAPALVVHRKTLKNKTLSKEERCYSYLVRVRDSSEKPATGVACEDLQRIARPRSAAQGTRPRKNKTILLKNVRF